MRILSLGNFGTSWDGSICDEEHVAQALEMLGHEVDRCQRESLELQNTEYDFVLIQQWDGYPENLTQILRVYKCPIVYWAFDYQKSGQDWHERLIKGADLYLSPLLEDKHPNHRWLPQAFAPMFLDKVERPKEYDVVFTGTYLPEGVFRTKVLKAVDAQFNLFLFSVTPNEWLREGIKNVHPPVLDQALPELVAKSRITLSVDLFPGNPGCWSDRNSQVMACGGFVLYKYAPLSEEEFGDGVAYFKTVSECLEKIDYYLKNPLKCEQIANKGYELAQTRLMAVHRVKNLLTIVENL